MKHVRRFLMAVLLLVRLSSWAYDIKVDGIYYNIIGNTELEVTFENGNYNSYFGRVIIPDIVEYQGNIYSVTSIGRYAFFRSDELVEVDIPNTVISIQIGAFRGCSSLTAINIPNAVSIIPDEAFRDCKSLTSVIIPNDVVSIGMGAFRACSELTQITIGDAVESIGNMAFVGCGALSSIFIPGSVRNIGERAFASCSALTGFVVDPTNVSYHSESGVLYNKGMDTLVQYPCGKEGPFIIPNTVSFIIPRAFINASKLSSIHLNDLVHVDWETFGGCGLQSVIVNSSNEKYTTIDGTLYNHNQDTLIFYPPKKNSQHVIPNTVSVIGARAFYGSVVASVVFPNSLRDIGYEAFCWCDSLRTVDLPASVKRVECGAFASCASLKSINVDTQNRYYSSMDGVLFNYCQDTIIQYPAGKIGKTYAVPNTVIAVNDGYNRELSQIYGGYTPSGVFSKSKLQSVSIPNTVNYVGHYAFYNCPILSLVTLGSAVDSIGIYAFSQDSVLRAIVCLGTQPPKYDPINALFWNANDNERRLVVPCEEKDVYIEKWGSFFAEIHIEEACEGHAIQTISIHSEYGSVNTTTEFAMLGDIVDIIINPNLGYAPYAVEVVNTHDETMLVPVSNYKFIMPNFDVTLKAYFYQTAVEENETNVVCISPNPVTDRVKITCEDMKSITLCTSDGRIVKMFNSLNMNDVEIDLMAFSKGLYILRIELRNGLVFNKKMIIQ